MTANAEQREHWNADEAHHWVQYEDVHNTMLEPFGRAILGAAKLQPGESVLDVGCGTGWTSIGAGERVGPEGAVLGADLSEPMLVRARERAGEAGLEHVRFAVADAQTDALDGPFDAIISRFGVMFFDDPPAAFTNLRRALADDGRLAFVCWQDLLANEWMAVPGAAVATRIPLPDLGPPGAPGPFSLSDPAAVRTLLSGAGFGDVAVEPFDTTVTLGGGLPLDDTLEYLRTSGLGRAVFAGATPAQVDDAIDAVRAALQPYETDDGVRLGGAAWVVTATG
jgi:SAM-dependent methyltransferase